MAAKYFKLIALTFTLCIVHSCDKNNDENLPPGAVPAIVRNRLNDEREKYMNERKTVCMVNVLVRAEDFVDSVLADSIKFRIVDNLFFPDRPLRPTHPGVIHLNDSMKIRPLLR